MGWRFPVRSLGAFSGVIAGSGAAFVVLIVLALAGYSPMELLATAGKGLVGSPISATRLGLWAQHATPLLFTGLAAVIALRSGVLNIGLEGQYLCGAVAAVALLTSGPQGWAMPWLAVIAGGLAGALWCLAAVGLDRWRGVPLVLSTILLNLLAVHALGVLVEGPLHDPATQAPQSAVVPEANRCAALLAGTSLHLGALAAVMAIIAAWVLLSRTVIGFELTVIGANPLAAAVAGMPVGRRTTAVAAASGALAGAAGAFQVAGVTFVLTSDAASYGYAGIAVALLARLHPLAVIPAALFMSGLDVVGRQWERRLGIPHDVGDIAKGLAVLGVLLFASPLVMRFLERRRSESAHPESTGTHHA